VGLLHFFGSARGMRSTELKDRIEPALSFLVMEADFFGTGRTPPTTDGFFLPHCRWQVRKTGSSVPELDGD